MFGTTRRAVRSFGAAALIVISLVAVQVALVVPNASQARADTPFGPVFSTNAPGDIVFVSNHLGHCAQGTPNCASAQAGGNWNNNDINTNMVWIDVDGDPTTFNSSTADYTMPAGGSILWAGLYWSGYYTGANGDKDDIKLSTPDSGGYVPITATWFDDWDGSDDFYVGFAEVTSLVQAGGTGTYAVADMAINQNNINSNGGWSIVIVQQDPAASWKNLTVNQGFDAVTGSVPQIDVNVSGFNAPPIGPVNAEVGMISFEGDLRAGGDYAELNGVRLSNALNPADNFFNSSITTNGAYNPGLSPNFAANTLGYDADIISTSGIIAPSSTSATVRVGTAGEWFFPSVVTTAIDIYVPNLTTNLTKSSTDLNGGKVHPGDVLEYSISFDNTGEDPAIETVVSDVIPPGTTYVPGSLFVVADDSPTGPRTDAVDGDTAWFDGSTVYFNIGAGADGTNGGQIDPVTQGGGTYEVRFRVLVDDDAGDTTVSNIANVDYVAQFIGEAYTTSTGPVDDPVIPLADLTVSKTDAADPVTAGENVEYAVTVSNAGPSNASNVVITDTLPAGLTFSAAGSDPSCSAAGQTVTCSIGTLGVTSQSLTINAVVDPGTTTASVTNSVSVATDTDESDETNNVDSEPTAIVRNADLSVEKSAASTVAAGEQLTYSIVVSNDGSSSAQNVDVVDALPAGVVLDTATATAGGACTGAVTCSWSSLDPGASATVTVVVDVPANMASGSSLTNSVSVTSADPDNDPSNNADSVDTNVVAEADLAVTKQLATPLVAGTSATYNLDVTNNGPSDASSVVIADAVPAGLTFNSAGSSAGCSEAAGIVTCSTALLTTGATSTFTLAFDLDQDLADGASISNTATVSSDAVDPNPTNNTDTVTDTVDRHADVWILKDDNTTTVAAGGQITYSLDFGNNGPSEATNVSITDTLPTGVTFTSSPDCSFTAPSTVTCSIGTLASGANGTATFVVDVDSALPDTASLLNSATISASEDDPSTTNNSSVVSTDIERVVNLTIEKDDVSDPIIAGEIVTYSIALTNIGPSVETNATIVDQLPAGMDFVSVSDAANCSATDATVTCLVGTMNPGEQYTVTIEARLDAGLPDGTILSNTATGDGDVADPVDDTEETTASARADLSVIKSAPGSVIAGNQLTYTLSVANAGPSTAASATISDTLPAGLSYVSHSVTAGAATCTEDSGVFGCSLGNVAPGATTTIELTVAVDPSIADGTPVTNSAVVDSETTDLDPTNNSSSTSTTVDAVADLATTKTTLTDPVVAGENATFQVTVLNDGPSTATGVTVGDVLPAGFVFDASNSSAGCTAAVSCPAGTLLPGQSATFTIATTVDGATSAGTYTNSATASSDTTDPDTTNNGDTSTVDVELQADLQIVKSSDTPTIVPGTTATWTITVTNNGPSDAAAVQVADSLPSGVTFTSASSSPACSAGVTCALGTLAAGETVSVTIAGDVDEAITGPVANTATVSSSTPDPTPGNNSSTETTPATPTADLALTKSGPGNALAGTQATYTFSLSNNGPSTATNVTVTDVLPAGMTFNAAASSGSCAAGVTCTVPNLAPGGSAVVTVVVDLDPTIANATTLTNSAEVETSAIDPDSSNDTDAVDTSIASEADIQTVKSAPSSATAGENVTYDITVVNNGPATATSVVVADTLPAGFTVDSVTTGGGLLCSGAGSLVGCSVSTLAPGASATVEIVANIDASIADGTTAVNSASANADQTDPNPANNIDTAPVTVERSADLIVSKASAPTTPTAGETLTYTITVTNQGPSDAQGIEVTDAVPASLAIDAALSAEMDCTFAGQTVACSQSTLANGATATVTIETTVDSALAAGSTISNSATATATTPDPDPSNNTGTNSVESNAAADLQLTKTTSKPVAVAGEWHPYTLTIGNDGPSTATGVVVTDTLPAGTSFNAALSDASCSEAGGVVTCALGDLAPQVSSAAVVVVDIPASFADASSLNNSASVTADQPDPDSTNNTSSVTTPVNNSADVSIVKDGDGAAVPGEPYTWILTGINDGPSNADNVVISDALPAGTSLAAGSDPRCNEVAGLLTCTIGTMAPGSTETLEVIVDVDPSVGNASNLVNTAEVTSSTADRDLTNNESTDTATTTRTSELDVTKWDLADPVVAGDEVGWMIEVTNIGPSDADNVQVLDALPAEVTFVSVDDPRCTHASSVLTCSLPVLPAGDTVLVTVRATVAPSVEDGAILSNTVTVTSNSSPTVSDTESTTTRRTSDVTIQKSSDGLAVAGLQQTYTVTVENRGPSHADNVVVTDILPTGFVFASSAEPGCGAAGQIVTCTLGTLTDLEVVSFDIVVDVLDTAATASRNNITVTSDNPDPDQSNDDDDDETTVGQEADLDLEKRFVGSAVPGEPVMWEIDITNNGPSEATNVVVTDTLDDSLAFDSTASSPGCLIAGQDVICNAGVLTSGETASFVVVAALEPGFTGELTNTAAATSDTPDPDPENNESATATPAEPSSDLSFSKVATTTDVVAGETLIYEMTATNAGPSTATNVVIEDVVPPGLTFDSALSDPSCAMDEAAGLVTCAFDNPVNPDSATSVLVGFTIANDVADGTVITNNASVASEVPDPDPANNTGDATVPADRAVELALSKELVEETVTPGTTANWILSVTNNGPSTASFVQVVDTLPHGLEFVEEGSSPECSPAAAVVTCATLSLSPGETVEFEIATSVAVDLPIGNITNTATTTSNEGGDDESDVTVPVVGNDATLVVEKTGPDEAVMVGQSFAWTVTVTNEGPEAITVPVRITDPLPATLTFDSLSSETLDCSESGGIVRCEIASLGIGETATLDIRTTATASGDVTNVVSVDALGITEDQAAAASAAASIEQPPPSALAFTGRTIHTTMLFATLLIAIGLIFIVPARRRKNT